MNNVHGRRMTTPPPHTHARKHTQTCTSLLRQAVEASLNCGKTCCNNFIIILEEELVANVVTFI
jgi:hypothetical protein